MSKGRILHEERSAAAPDRLLHRLSSLLARLPRDRDRSETELYHRASIGLRVLRRAGSTSPASHRGHDEGLAVRTRSGGERRLSFAACSGSSEASLRWILDRAGQCGPAGGAESDSWSRGAKAVRVDRDEQSELPSQEELAEWLDRAWSGLRDPESPAAHRLEPIEAWVEVASTIESWAGDGGLKASRVRRRAWALVRLRRTDGCGSTPRPLQIAARRWPELSDRGWRDLLEDQWFPAEHGARATRRRGPVLFNPACSSRLILALVTALHRHDHEEEVPVGPAWKLVDDPGEPTALYGGSFDDAGFPSRRKRLADGERTIGILRGRGHYRRPSYRDRPAPLPSHLHLTAKRGDPPPRGILVSGLTLHPLAPNRWALEIEGAELEGGRPGRGIRGAVIHVAPEELVRRCVTAVGPPRDSYRGVRTPGLVFDGLEVGG